MGSSKKTVGYKYYLGVHAGICLGPVDEISQLTFDDRVGWTGSVTGPATIQVKQTELFGGENGQGGVLGDVDVMMGGPTQMPNPYLVSRQGPESPGYRGFVSLVFRGTKVIGLLRDEVIRSFYWTANSPYIKPFGVKARRVLKGWDNDVVWYAAKAAIGRNMNPAHIIYQCVTSTWGMGRPVGDIEDAVWRATADQLHAEGFGLSLLWTREATVEDFIQTVVNHIGGNFYMNRSTGKFELVLIRDGYDVGTLPTLGPGSAVVKEFQRRAWGETTNQITVNYSNGASNDETSVTVQNLANIRQQGGNVVQQVVSYPGIRDGDLAYRVAQRDLMALSSPLATVKLATDRRAWNWNPGDLFVLSWPPLGIESLVLRIGKIDLGSLEQGIVTIDAVEDVFGLPNSSYAAAQPPMWQDPYADPVQIATYRIEEATYYDLALELGDTDAEALSFAVSRGQALCLSPAVQNVSVDMVLANEVVGDGPYCDTALLAAAVGPQDTVLSYSGDTFFDELEAGLLFYVGNELMAVVSNDTTAKTITVQRGVVDTLPASHAIGARLWLHNSSSAALDGSDRAAGATVSYKLQARGYANVAPIAGAPTAALTIPAAAGRHARPWPPACVKIDGTLFPDTAPAGFTITWSTRNRLIQTVGFVSWLDAASVPPESDVTFTLEVYNADTNALLQTVTGLTGGSYIYRGTTTARMRAKLYAVRSGIASWQAFEHTFELLGWGMNWGNDWSGTKYGTVIAPLELPPDLVASNASRLPVPFGYMDNAGGGAGAFGFASPISSEIPTPWLAYRYLGFPAGAPTITASWANTDAALWPFDSYGINALAGGDWGAGGAFVFMPRGVYTRDLQTFEASNFLAAPRYSGGGMVDVFTYINGRFLVAIGTDLLYSLDGATWVNPLGSTPASANALFGLATNGNSLSRIYYMGGKYIAVFDRGTSQSGPAVVAESTNLVTWAINAAIDPRLVVHFISGSTYVAFEQTASLNGTNDSVLEYRFNVWRSTDNGATFTLINSSLPDSMGMPVRSAPGQPFFSIGFRRIGWSTDGVTWSHAYHGLDLTHDAATRMKPVAARNRLYVYMGGVTYTAGGRVYVFTQGSGTPAPVWPTTNNYLALSTSEGVAQARLTNNGLTAASITPQNEAVCGRLTAVAPVFPVGSPLRRYAEFLVDRIDSAALGTGDPYVRIGVLGGVALSGSTVFAYLDSRGYSLASVATSYGRIISSGAVVGVGLECSGNTTTVSFWVDGSFVGSSVLDVTGAEQIYSFVVRLFKAAVTMRRSTEVQHLPSGYTAI